MKDIPIQPEDPSYIVFIKLLFISYGITFMFAILKSLYQLFRGRKIIRAKRVDMKISRREYFKRNHYTSLSVLSIIWFVLTWFVLTGLDEQIVSASLMVVIFVLVNVLGRKAYKRYAAGVDKTDVLWSEQDEFIS